MSEAPLEPGDRDEQVARQDAVTANRADMDAWYARADEIIDGAVAFKNEAEALSQQSTNWSISQQKAVADRLGETFNAIGDLAVAVKALLRDVYQQK